MFVELIPDLARRRELLPSPSSLGRVAACLPSEILPHTLVVAGALTERGTVAHSFLETVLSLAKFHSLEEAVEIALAEAPEEHRPYLEAIDVAALPAAEPEAYVAEVSFAYDVKTGKSRELGRRMRRDDVQAARKAGEIAGTIDILGAAPEAAVVLDYKTGRGFVEKAETNWQLGAYGLMAARALGLPGVVRGALRVLENSNPFFDLDTMDASSVDVFEAKLRNLVRRRDGAIARAIENLREKRPLLEGAPSFVEGPHCKYCPAFSSCPTKTKHLIELARDGAVDPRELVLPEWNEELAAAAWKKVALGYALLDRMKSALKDYAAEHPFSLGDGMMVGPNECVSEPLIATKLREPLEKTFGPVVAAAVISETVETKVSATKEKFERALKKHLLPTRGRKRGVVGELLREAYGALRAAKAMDKKTSHPVQEYRLTKKKLASKGEAKLVAGEACDATKPEESGGEEAA